MKKLSFLFILSILFYKNELYSQTKELVLSAIKGKTSRPDTLKIPVNLILTEIQILGEQADFFKVELVHQKENALITFQPSGDFIGIAKATLKIKTDHILLTGLSTNGLEGENEAPLSQIVDALGYKTEIGWKTLSNHWRPELQGEELPPSLFKKAGAGKVEMIPLARYSPDFLLNFGYYTPSGHGPDQSHVGVLAKAKQFPEHQILFPGLASGKKEFDPQNKTFGFYAISPSHTAYSEDIWNILFYPSHAPHAVRVYPVKDKTGNLIKNNYLVCFEEAANGDYNDYVFLLKNIQPVYLKDQFSKLFNGINFDGWYTWLENQGKNIDPNKVFTVEKDGIIHDTGKELGYIMTQKRYNNYHFSLEFKWGLKRWPPRENNKRDSGICYHVPDDAEDKIWPNSVECQIQEGDVGDFWLLDNATIQVDGKQNAPSAYTQIIKKKDAEKPSGEWNTVEVLSFNGKCVHIVNGVVVNYGENASVVGGRILLQSEYAEIFYRNIKLRELK